MAFSSPARLLLIAVTVLFIMTAPGGGARAQDEEAAKGLPRMASLRSDEVNVRFGPGVRHPVQWVFLRKGMPVEIVAEFETWRKIRDWEGQEGWIHRAMLSSKRTLVVTAPEITMRRNPDETSPAVARLAEGVVASIDECNADWCMVETHGYDGWIRRTGIWGLYPGEKIEN